MEPRLELAILRVLKMAGQEIYDREAMGWTVNYRDDIACDLAEIDERIGILEKEVKS